VKIAIFPLRLLLFYIVYNGGKSGSVRAQPRPPAIAIKEERKTVMEAMMIGMGLLFAASLFGTAQSKGIRRLTG
jgi:hypothetical protein